MEDYDVFNEMHNIKDKVIMIATEDEKLLDDIKNMCEIMPLRFSYDLSSFSNSYIESTKSLFSYYFNKNNQYKNELIRIKKHFTHFARHPYLIYVSKQDENYSLIKKVCEDLNIECISNKKLFISKIKNDRKLFLIDIDGTLVDDSGKVSEQNIKAIAEIRKRGDYAVLCTARPRYYALNMSEKCNASNYIISTNGAETYDIKKNLVIKNYYIEKNSIYYLIEICFKKMIRLVISTDNFEFVNKEVRNSHQVLLDEKTYKSQLKRYKIKSCLVIDDKEKSVLNLKDEVTKNTKLSIINEKTSNDHNSEEWFTVGNIKVNKGIGLLALANYLKIPLKNVISIGNDYNDISMFQRSGHSFAVSNANDIVKHSADTIVSSNNDNGVAEIVKMIYVD